MGAKSMRVIIAGGSGLIGRELTALLAVAGDEVIIFSRTPQKVVGLPPEAKVIAWDGKTLQVWSEYVENADAIINLTGENLSGEGIFPTRWTVERKKRLVDSRVNSGTILTQAVENASHKPSVFIQASAIGYYGTHLHKSFTEQDAGGDDFSANLCKQWEASSQAAEAMGVRRVITRNGVVLSTKGGALRPILLPYRMFVGGPLGDGRQIYSWIHIADEAGAIQFLLRNENASGVFNLTSPNPVSNAEFGYTIARVLHRPHYFPLPGFLMHMAFGEVASMVLEGQKVLPQKLLDSGYKFRYPVLQDALTELLHPRLQKAKP
jgi:uncharacterized protein (TIGR01777 family)